MPVYAVAIGSISRTSQVLKTASLRILKALLYHSIWIKLVYMYKPLTWFYVYDRYATWEYM